MVFFHVGLTTRCCLKGHFKQFFNLYKYDPTKSRVITTRHYLGITKVSIPLTDFKKTEVHINNTHFSTAFEAARWEAGAANGFNMKCIRAKCYPMIASTYVNYLRSLHPFTVVTIQTCLLGICAEGKQIAFTQCMYDDQNRLCAVGVYSKALVDSKTGKTMMIKEGLRRMGVQEQDVFLLSGDAATGESFVMGDPFDSGFLTAEKKPTEKFQSILDRAKRDPFDNTDLSGFEPKNGNVAHKISSEESLKANAESIGRISAAMMTQRKWFWLGRAAASTNKNAEGKGGKKNN